MEALSDEMRVVNSKEVIWSINRYESVWLKKFKDHKHTHIEAEVIYVVSGKCEVTAANTQHVLKEGQFIFIDEWVEHSVLVDGEISCRVLAINVGLEKARKEHIYRCSDLLDFEEVRSFWLANDKVAVFEDNESLFYYQLSNLFGLLSQKRSEMEIFMQTSLLFYELVRKYWASRKSLTEGISSDVKLALNYMEKHYDEEVTVEEIAAAVNLSRSRLQHKFSAETGQTMIEKLHEIRIRKAQYLLETSILSISEIAFTVGFNSRQHFADVFRKINGDSPSEYRRCKGVRKNLKG